MSGKRKYFGTDGIRHLANSGPLMPHAITRLAMAAGTYFKRSDGRPAAAIIGRDTRLSGDMIEAAITAGLASVGTNARLCGVIPTPGVALMTASEGADFGVMITASHNQFQDNGIKFFGPGGLKLSDDDELAIEAILDSDLAGVSVDPAHMGRARTFEDAAPRYTEIAKSAFPKNQSLSGLKIVIDCANGAAFQTAPQVFSRLGADEVISIGVSPDGKNINKDCGSTRTDLMSNTVIETGAHVGVALDGDADRLIMCDETGRIIDGDQLLGLIGSGWHEQGRLTGGGIVATVMSNLGLERFLGDLELSLERTDVGDRHVAARMRSGGFNVGGEQSGHLLLTDFSPAGDGTIAALQVLAEILRKGRPASEVLSVFEPVPQLLKNVRYSGASPMEKTSVMSAIEDARSDMGVSGRILVRTSGTEPVIRVMAEGDDPAKVSRITDTLAAFIETA